MRWSSLLPERFDFYHLGEVRAEPIDDFGSGDALPQFADSRGALFQIDDRATDETIAWLVVVFDEGLDPATYAEMGNVIASRFAGRVATEQSLSHGATPSPPRELSAAQLVRLFSARTNDVAPVESRVYLHALRDRAIAVRAFILPPLIEGEIAHA